MTNTDTSAGTSTDTAVPASVGRKVLVAIAGLAVLAGFAWWVSALGGGGEGSSGPAATGDSVIEEFGATDRVQQVEVSGETLGGDTYRSTELLGEVVVYNVWGSWCAPCVKEAPDLVEVANEYTDRVVFVGLNTRDNDAAARAFERTHKVPYDSVVSADSGDVMLSFGSALAASAVPTTLVVDREGRVAARAVGPVTAATLRALLDAVLEED